MQDENDANKFVRAVLKFDPTMQYKATTKDGKIFKSKGYDDAKIQFDETEFTKFNKQIKRTGF